MFSWLIFGAIILNVQNAPTSKLEVRVNVAVAVTSRIERLSSIIGYPI